MDAEAVDRGVRLVLEKGRIWSGRIPARRSLEVTCLSGRLWITQEGDAADYFLGPGEGFRPDRPGLVVAEAMSDFRGRIRG